DFVFAHRVRTDPTMPMRGMIEGRISSAQALDDHTLYLEWKVPYLWAGMITSEYFAPLPSHLLEQMYLTNKERFINGSQWRADWVGSGPYKLARWEPGVEMVLRAHDGFAFGTPPIPQITLKFIQDTNTVTANLLSGEVDVAFHSSIDFAQNQALEQTG